MTLKSQIDTDFINAYKAKEEAKVSLLRMVKSAIKNSEINERTTLNDTDVIKVLKREIKQRESAIAEYLKGNRPELAAKEELEIEIIREYLPEQLNDSELAKMVNDTINELCISEMKDMGRAISAIMKKAGDRADGGKISALVKTALQK